MQLLELARLVLLFAALAIVGLVNLLQLAGKGQLGITLAGAGVAWLLYKLVLWSY